jgi:hypothetical protein
MTVKQVAELQLAYPTFTEGVPMAAQKICQAMGIGRFPGSGAISDPKNEPASLGRGTRSAAPIRGGAQLAFQAPDQLAQRRGATCRRSAARPK